MHLTELVDKIDKELTYIESHIKKDIENANFTYHNMDGKDKDIISLKEQLSHIDIPKNLIMPELKVDFADLVDELESLRKRKDADLALLNKRSEDIIKLRKERDQEIRDEIEAIKEAKKLIKKEDFDGAERALQRVLNHKLDEKIVKIKEVVIYTIYHCYLDN